MRGTNARTGKALEGVAHLRQSIADILTTRIGSRVMRRDYGSRLYELVDAPLNRSVIADIIAATAEAIGKWEPRIRVDRVTLDASVPGEILVNLTGEYLPDGTPITLDGIRIK